MPNSGWSPRRAPELPAIAAHRGVHSTADNPVADAVENTLEAAQLAVESPAQWIEFDVRPCADGLVVHHDPVTSSGQHIATTKLADLDPHVSSLSQFARACGPLRLDVELKLDDIAMSDSAFMAMAAEEIDELTSVRDRDDVIVTSFAIDALDEFHRLRPSVATGVLFVGQDERAWEQAMSRASTGGHSVLGPHHPLVQDHLVSSAHQAGLAVITWTVNRPAEINLVRSAGVDMIISDLPAQVAECLG